MCAEHKICGFCKWHEHNYILDWYSCGHPDCILPNPEPWDTCKLWEDISGQ
jgi:hypothetical protein